MVEYDPQIIQNLAERLYTKAQGVIISNTLIGAVIGYIAGSILKFMTRDIDVSIILIFICGIIGFVKGQEKAFQYKLEAQTALCQMKIEENTKFIKQ